MINDTKKPLTATQLLKQNEDYWKEAGKEQRYRDGLVIMAAFIQANDFYRIAENADRALKAVDILREKAGLEK